METNTPPALASYFVLQHLQNFKHASSQALADATRASLAFCRVVNIAGDVPLVSNRGGQSSAAQEVHISHSVMSNWFLY